MEIFRHDDLCLTFFLIPIVCHSREIQAYPDRLGAMVSPDREVKNCHLLEHLMVQFPNKKWGNAETVSY